VPFLFHSPQSDHYRPPSSLASGRFLTLLAIQLIAVVLGLIISRDLYSTYQVVIGGHERLASIRQQEEHLSEGLDRALQQLQGHSLQPNQIKPLAVELDALVATSQVLVEAPIELPNEKVEVQQRLAELKTMRLNWSQDGSRVGNDETAMAASVIRLQGSLAVLRTGMDRLDEENFRRLYDIRNVGFWNNVCEAFACILMLVAFGWAVRLYRHLRHEELARFRIESELSAERRALEQRVRTRTAALETEVKERQRVERMNRGRNHILLMVARNEPFTAILQVLAETLAEYQSTWACAVHTLEAGQLKLAASAGLNDKVKLHLGFLSTDHLGAPESQALAFGKPFLIEDLGEEHRTWSELLRANGLLSVWSAPFMASDGCALGTITIYTLLKWNATPSSLEMLETGCNMASLVMERSRMQAQLVDHAYHDSLTGLPNRRLGRDRLFSATCRAERASNCMAVLWIDLDRFKLINDRHGHPIGDAVLQKIAQRLSGRLRACDTLARMGGDEFMAVVEAVGSRNEATAIASDLLEIIRQPMQIGELELNVSASIGISVFPEDGDTVDSLAQHADQAMYAAKFGSNGVLSFIPDMDRVPAERRELEEEMRLALENGGFSMAYQPICLPDGTLKGFEALLRFNSPRLGMVPPSHFIPIAEDCHLIVAIGEWVLREVCRQSRVWQDAGLPTHSIAVNISALQFSRDDFADTVAKILEETGESGDNLILELTESIVMNDFLESARQMKRLKRLGVRIAVDDFGTGYSSLSYLHRLPIDVLKIDRSFMENINENDGTRPIVEAVLSMARTLGLRVVAEGVETVEQLDTLRQCGCGVIQGFFFSQPVSPATAEVFLQQGCLEGGQKAIMAPLLGNEGPELELANIGF